MSTDLSAAMFLSSCDLRSVADSGLGRDFKELVWVGGLAVVDAYVRWMAGGAGLGYEIVRGWGLIGDRGGGMLCRW